MAAALCAIAIVGLDGPLAMALSSLSADSKRPISQFVHGCEVLFAFGISPYLYGSLLLLAGLLGLARRTNRLLPRALVFVGASHLTARFLADILKPPFSRLRPFEALASGGWHDTWFASVGNSFPAGHAVHVWSLFFPLLVFFPRHGLRLAVVPTLVSVARVAMNDHYLSDVLASASLAALVTSAYAIVILRPGPKHVSNR